MVFDTNGEASHEIWLRPKDGILRSFEFEGTIDQRGFSRNRFFNFRRIGPNKQDVIRLDAYATYASTKRSGSTGSRHIPACIVGAEAWKVCTLERKGLVDETNLQGISGVDGQDLDL